MPRYIAYGLTIDSEIDLPELPGIPATGEADLRVAHGAFPELPPDGFDDNAFYLLRPGLACAGWRGGGIARMRDGRELTMRIEPGADPDVLRSLILGPFMAMLLHQRGSLVLHGSGVAIDGGVVAFIGETGRGKSTIAAAFVSAGYPLISDDLLAVTIAPGEAPSVAPGLPFIKLWPESARALGRRPEELPQITSAKEKRMMRVEEGMIIGALPLRAIYLLGGESEIPIEPVGPQEGLLELTRHSYCSPALVDAADMRRHFLQCSGIVNRVPIRRLNRAFPIERLEEMVELVREESAGFVRGGE